MKKTGYETALYRGEMDKVERRANLKLFREGKIELLISTDLRASRVELDVEHVERVINYHLPQQLENYLHRVGRTARAGRQGLVLNFVTERDEPFVSKLATLRSRAASSAGAKLEAANAWPAEPEHKKPLPKVAPIPRGKPPGESQIVVKLRK